MSESKPLQTAASKFSAEAIIEASKQVPQGNRRATRYELLDLDPLRRGAGDAQARSVVLAALAEHDQLKATLARVVDVRHTEKALAHLRAAGVSVPEDIEARAFFNVAPSPTLRDEVVASLAVQIRDRLAAAADPEVKRVVGALVAELKSELVRVETFEEGLFQRWPALALAQAGICSTITSAIERLEAELSKPLDLAWHYDSRIALSCYFKEFLAPVPASETKESIAA